TWSMREPPIASRVVSPGRWWRSERRQPRDTHANTVYRGRGRDVKGAEIVVAKGHVGRVLGHADDAEIDGIGAEDVDSAWSAAVHVALRVELHPVGRALALALRPPPPPPPGQAAVALHVEDADVLASRVVHEEAAAVEREAEPVRAIEVVHEHGRRPRAGSGGEHALKGELLRARDAEEFGAAVGRVAEVDPAVRRADDVGV